MPCRAAWGCRHCLNCRIPSVRNENWSGLPIEISAIMLSIWEKNTNLLGCLCTRHGYTNASKSWERLRNTVEGVHQNNVISILEASQYCGGVTIRLVGILPQYWWYPPQYWASSTVRNTLQCTDCSPSQYWSRPHRTENPPQYGKPSNVLMVSPHSTDGVAKVLKNFHSSEHPPMYW